MREDIAKLIPHQGEMCLWEHVMRWDETRIVLETTSHAALTNPLRSDHRLRAVHLCEYGAQAMAVHGALTANARVQRMTGGMLVALRSVQFHCDYIEQLAGSIVGEATCLQATVSTQQYGFRLLHAGVVLAEGRAAVVLGGRE
jgi:predicted hotdog family 3-hydroxylacyl-ACP dehydratase